MFRSEVPDCSGGFPHSEIPGSKPILGSPGLIAEYHVLHRLLLPRHPPNALLALDLIQKKTGFFRYAALLPRETRCRRSPCGDRRDQKHTIPLPRAGSAGGTSPSSRTAGLVYLTWVSCRAVVPQARPTWRGRHETDVYLFARCNRAGSRSGAVRPDGEAPRRLAVRSPGRWWVEEDLNLRPHAYQACALTT